MTLIYLTMAWAAGIVSANRLAEITPNAALLIALIAGLLGAVLRKDKTLRIVLFCLVFLMLGNLRMQVATAPPRSDDIRFYNDQGWQAFSGIIAEAPDVRDNHVNLTVNVTAIEQNYERAGLSGTVLVQSPRYGGYVYGDEIRFTGTPLTPPEFDDFSYQDYLARQGIHTLIPNADVSILSHGHGNRLYTSMMTLRDTAEQRIGQALPEPHASLLTGILLGIETGISPEVRDAFNTTGASHVIAISGFNMTLIAAMISGALGAIFPNRRQLTVGISAGAIIIYTLFVGANAAVVRAAIMSLLLIIAPLFQRRTYVPASLAFAALIMSILNPHVLWDVGFQLSFAAVLGLALFVSPIERIFRSFFRRFLSADSAERTLQVISEPLIVTLAAQIVTLPLILFYFGRLSLSSFAVNFLILPAQTPLLLLGGLATIIALAAPAVAYPFYLAAWLFLRWTVFIVRRFAAMPGGSIVMDINIELVVVFYGLLAFGMILQGTRPGWYKGFMIWLKSRRIFSALFATGGITAVVLWLAVLDLPDGKLHVHFLDSGHSNGVLIQTPDGIDILIDGGKYPTRLLTALGDQLPFWDRQIEILFITQPKNAQIAALPAVMERYTIQQVLYNGQTSDSDNVVALFRHIAADQIPLLPVYAGYAMETSDGVIIQVLYPDQNQPADAEPNDSGLILKVTYGASVFLLTPDISTEAEAALLNSAQHLQSAVLQIPSHGSASVSSHAFVDAVAPQIAVVQVDTGNRYGHPAQEVIDRLDGIPLYRTDHHGRVTISSDGVALFITTEN